MSRLDEIVARIQAHTAAERRLSHAVDEFHTEAEGADSSLAPPSPASGQLRPLSLTYVAYREGDALGKVAALVTLAPLVALVALGAWIVARRELRALCLLLGALLNALLCAVLKAHFQQPRPAGAAQQDFGMPSNHAQTSAYLATTGLCFLWLDATVVHAALWKPLTTLTTLALVALVGASRVYLGEHTVEQVCAGLAAGSAAGLAVHFAYGAALPALRPVLAWRCARYFYLRETSHVRDVMRVEHEWHAGGVAHHEAQGRSEHASGKRNRD